MEKYRPSDHRAGKNVYETLAEVFELTREDLDAVVEGPPVESKWENMVRFAKRNLVDMGCMDGLEWGVWKLTEKGWKAAKSKIIPGLEEKLIRDQLSKLSPSAKAEILKLLADGEKET